MKWGINSLTQKGARHALLNEDINNIYLKRDPTFLLASQEWQRSNSKAVPNSIFHSLGQNKLECKHLLFILHLFSLHIILYYNRTLPFGPTFM